MTSTKAARTLRWKSERIKVFQRNNWITKRIENFHHNIQDLNSFISGTIYFVSCLKLYTTHQYVSNNDCNFPSKHGGRSNKVRVPVIVWNI